MTGTKPSPRVTLPVASSRQVLHYLFIELRGYRGAVARSLTLVIIACASGLIAPQIIGWWVDDAASLTWQDIIRSAMVVIAAAVVGSMCIRIGIPLYLRVGNHIVAKLRERTLSHVLHLPFATLNAAGIGDVVTRTRYDVSEVSNTFTRHAAAILTAFLTLIVLSCGLLSVDWRLTVIQLAISILLYVLVLRNYLTRSLALYRESLHVRSEVAQAAISSLRGRATVRAYMLEKQHLKQITELSWELRQCGLVKTRWLGTFLARINAVEFVGLSLLLLAGFVTVRLGYVSVGEVTTAGLYCLQTFEPVKQLLTRIPAVQDAGASLGRLIGVLGVPTELAVPADSKDVSVRKGPPLEEPVPLVFSGVSHRFADDRGWVLSDVSLTVAPGERVAVVGISGAGKSTLASIGAGLLRPSAGSVQVGGLPVSELGLADRVCLVTQDIHVFSGPLADDVRLGNPDAGDDDVWAALETVGAASWARALPDGLHTEVGESGHRLTAAQAQQLALARVALVDPRVVILDEATAEAGSAGARILETAADRVMRGRTALVIAHRLSQAETADRVVVLNQGRIAEMGTHAELVAEGGRYSQLWQHWSTTH